MVDRVVDKKNVCKSKHVPLFISLCPAYFPYNNKKGKNMVARHWYQEL